MTPFATEISNSIARFMSHKAEKEILSDADKLITALADYMNCLYPSVRKNKKEKLICFAKDHKKCQNAKCQNDVEEWTEYVPVYIVVDYEEPAKDNIIRSRNMKFRISKKILTEDDTTYMLHIDYQRSNICLIKEVIEEDRTTKGQLSFWAAMHKLENQLTNYTDIKNGFVVFISNNYNYVENGNIEGLLKCTNFDKISLLPRQRIDEIGEISPCQLIWKQTRDKEFNCCVGTFDGYFNSTTYPCVLSLRKETSSFNHKFSLLEKTVSEYKPYKAEEERPDYIHLFYQMLKQERLITSRKKTFGEWENPYLNDYSRIMMSPAVRRMKDKTQVFTMDDSDFVRSRLTHSLEVANIAKLIGLGIEHQLLSKDEKQFKDIRQYNIPNILEVAGLIHDIGNPPYGHFGEKTIQNFFRNRDAMSPRVKKLIDQLDPQQKADFENFDGNVQGFRILCHLGLSSDCTSFNLDKVVLSTMVKYPFNSLDGNKRKESVDHRKSKFGYFAKEEHLFEKICKSLHLVPGQRHPLAYLLEAADDITYIGDDIEDGWKLGYITARDIVKACEKLDQDLRKKIFNERWDRISDRLLSTNSIIVANAIQSMRISLQRYMIHQIIDVFCERIADIVLNQLPEDKQELFDLDRTLKDIHDVYWHPLVQKCYDGIHITQLRGERVLTSLLNVYLEAVADESIVQWEKNCDGAIEIKMDNSSKSGMLFETISDNYRDDSAPLGQFIPQDAYGKIMLVTDYIAGMTDSFAYNRYHELCLN